MKRLLAGAGTACVIGLLLWTGLRSERRRPPAGGASDTATAPDPVLAEDPDTGAEAALRALFESAREGDVDRYLSIYVPALRARLEREVAERGREAFAAELRRASQARKGHAIFAPEPAGPDAVQIAVETVYADRNERQVYRLVHEADGWRISDVESARAHQPQARYGSPAVFQEPEGSPVQGYTPEDTVPFDPTPQQ